MWCVKNRNRVTLIRFNVALAFSLLAVMMASIIVVNAYIIVNDEFSCLTYSTFESNLSEVNVQIVGTYCRKLSGQDTFSGNIYFTDRFGKQIGGKLDNASFTSFFNDYTAGQLFTYNSKTEKYEFLGQMFWNISQNRFVIQTSESYICYPAEEIADLNEHLDALNMNLVR